MVKRIPRSLLLALAVWLLASACGGGDQDGPAPPELQDRDQTPGPASGIVYARTHDHLIRFDLAKRTAEPQELLDPVGSRATADVMGNDIALASASRRSDDVWDATVRILDGDTGEERDQIALDPLLDVPLPHDSQGRLGDSGSNIRTWYLPQTHTLLAGIALVQADVASFRLDVIDGDGPGAPRSLDLGSLPRQSVADIRVASDQAGNVAVLLTSAGESRLFVGPPGLSSLEPVGQPSTDCSIVEAASTHRSGTRYFLCLGTTGTPLREASILIVDSANAVQSHQLPATLDHLQGGVADMDGRVFVGTASPGSPAVLALDLASGEVAATREFEPVFNSSWRERLKQFFLGRPVSAYTVVHEPIVVSPDGSRIFFTDGYTLWCLRPGDLSIAGQVQLQATETQALAIAPDGVHVIAAGVRRDLEIVKGATCRSVDSLPYSPSVGESALQILVPWEKR